ncbi:MAG TPA: circadian clock protein KaiC [Oligoflexus sp.]|uniref:circadian clock protein KaiC n=1 Tax=Oligoflexus sp. TaxID=1971216 RepID=UPI002D80274F|nr:circadian clock protein KaiC [Oligoflexus sp.]HET9240350.1 circadian clock protein KaiC [Oligoflexus sp.]
MSSDEAALPALQKVPTGIKGFDEITYGGLPAGRPTLVTGSAGSGKTLFGIEFLVSGVNQYHENGVFMCFEETEDDLAVNVSSLGFNLRQLVKDGKLAIDFVSIQRSEIEETGEYDLEAIFVRLDYAISQVGAKRVVLDTIEFLFGALKDTTIIRAELNRLFRWLKEKKVTAIITAEKGANTLTRHGLEEYVSDCVVFLDHRVDNQVSTRRLRVVKYRGSAHGTNEYPFLIDQNGFSVLPSTTLNLDYPASSERIPSGIPKLDQMLGGQGYYRGSCILVSGSAGTGKTSLGSSLVAATCRRGKKSLMFCFEETPEQLLRNMRSIGMELGPYRESGLLKIVPSRPSLFGLERHLVSIHKHTEEFKPEVLVIDPVTSFLISGGILDVHMMLLRLLDLLKEKHITILLLGLARGPGELDSSDVGISSLIDTWIKMQSVESNGERNRTIQILKSRGMDHSNRIRELLLTSQGIDLVDVYFGPNGILTGSARMMQQAQDRLRLDWSNG